MEGESRGKRHGAALITIMEGSRGDGGRCTAATTSIRSKARRAGGSECMGRRRGGASQRVAASSASVESKTRRAVGAQAWIRVCACGRDVEARQAAFAFTSAALFEKNKKK